MSRPDPFGFDIRVTADKKKKRGRRGMSGAFETSQRVCDHAGCEERGLYRAPKSREDLDDYFWFCKAHAREYNLKWNFFDGTTDEDFAAQVDSDRVWGRETKPFRQSTEERAWARLGVDDPHQVLGDNATRNPGKRVTGRRKLPPTERKAVEILEVAETASKAEIRKAYKALIKVLHPDMNGGDRSDEERLQEVVWAWDQVKDSRSFRD